MTDVDVARLVAEGQAKQLQTAELSAARVLEELRRLAFADPRQLFDARGNLRPINKLSAEDAAWIGGLDVIIANAKAGDGHMDTIHKVKLLDKTKALDLLARHFGLLKERITLETEDAQIAALLAGRKRVAAARKKA